MKSFLSLFGTVIFLIYTTGLRAQAPEPVYLKIDSLLQLLPVQKDSMLYTTNEKLFFAFLKNGDPKEAYTYLQAATSIANRLENKVLQADNNRAWHIYYFSISEFHQALIYGEKAIELYRELNDQKFLADGYNSLGLTYKYLGQLGLALESHLNSLRIDEAAGRPEKFLAPSLMNIGVLYSKLGELEVSNEYYQKVAAICTANDMSYCLAITRSNLATNLAETGNLEEALELYLEALPYFKENKLKMELGEQYNLIAEVYIQMDSLAQAEDYISNSLQTNQETGELSMLALAYRNRGDVKFKQSDFETSLENYLKSLELSQQASNNLYLVEDYLKISDSYERLGNITDAYHYRKLYFAAHDTLFNQRNRDKLIASEIQYKTEKKEQEIELQKKEIALLEEKQHAARLQRIGLITGLIATILFFGLGYYALRQKMKRNRLERERVKAELAFKKKELTTHALHLAKKNEVLEGLKQKARELKASEHNNVAYHQLIQTINLDQQDDNTWENFTKYFEAVHKDFAGNATKKYPDISRTELRLMALIKMNLSSKEIANILNISSAGVKKARQRLRKKMDLSRDDSLENTILSL